MSAVVAIVPWLLLVALASLVTAHLAIAIGLASQRAWKRAAIAIVVLPLAPYWAWREGMRVRVFVWLGAVTLYAIGVAIV